MNRLNLTAVAFWITCVCAGYIIADLKGAVFGLAVGTGLSVIASIISK